MLILLDLDGTLIHDRGYRSAIDAATLAYARMNALPQYAPSDEDVHVSHANGFSNEWDLVAFLAGILHHARLTDPAHRPDYQTWMRRTNSYNGLPNERARDALLHEVAPSLHPTIHRLLDRVTDVANSPTTRIFAEIILGSKLFEQHYGLPATMSAPSLLEELDVPLLDDHSREVILKNRSCIYTARPSLPPGHRDGNQHSQPRAEAVHPPEAEIALRQLKLESLPMIALGHVQWLADLHDERVYDLTKPGPVQALAAFLAAAGIGEQASLHAAYSLWKSNRLDGVYNPINGEVVYVLEDNAVGVKACHTAAAMLRGHGFNLSVHGLGISTAPVKRAALAPYCSALFDSVNDAVRYLEAQSPA